MNTKNSEEKRINATRKLYESGTLSNWMNRTVASNDYKWLVKGLKSIIDLKRKFDILSPSANNAYYEYQTYLTLKKEGYHCNFWVGDLSGESFYNEKVDEDGFIYIRKSQAAKNIKLNNKVDIVCDFKGAIWYSLKTFNSYKHTDLIQNLEAFSSYLEDDDSKLIFDIYKYARIRSLWNIWNYGIMDGKKVKKNTHQEEISTGYRLIKYLKKQKIENKFKIVTSCVLSSSEISLYYITKKDLDILITALKVKHKNKLVKISLPLDANL